MRIRYILALAPTMVTMPTPTASQPAIPHRRRARYAGKYPRKFVEKYKERQGDADTLARVRAHGKTPAGTHRPIMVQEILAALQPSPGQIAVDCTLGYGGHAEAILPHLAPGGKLIGLDADPIQLPRSEIRLRSLGFGKELLVIHRTNFAGLRQILAAESLDRVDMILADLGVSSMQLDDPSRGFTFKVDGPLDMRMNPSREPSAAQLIGCSDAPRLRRYFEENGDEPHAEVLANALAGSQLATTLELRAAIRTVLRRVPVAEQELSTRRVFQALRIAVNDEFAALDALLRSLPGCLRAGGRVAILSFHSGEDRRVKKSFQAGYREGVYESVSEAVRPSSEESYQNSRAASAKLRWAVRKRSQIVKLNAEFATNKRGCRGLK